ncbi:MAG: hypothetical protein ACREFR_00990 [Limisphaerales bacterium]
MMVTAPWYGDGGQIGYTNFAAYLTSKAWVREMIFDKSFVMNGKEHGFSEFKASLQPDGFFLQCLSNAPFGDIGNLYVFGESANQYWEISPPHEIDVSYKSQRQGGSTKNRLPRVAADMKQKTRDVLNLGIKDLDNTDIVWINPNRFIGHMVDWLGEPTTNTVRVEVQFQKHLPVHLDCLASTSNGFQEYSIDCRYNEPALPPYETVIAESIKGKTYLYTNIIRKIAFGTLARQPLGFDPSNFPAVFPAVEHLIVESNGTAYAVGPNGVWRQVNKTGVEPSQDISQGRRMAIRIVFLIFLVVLPVAAVLLKLRKTNKLKNNATKHH